LSTSNKNFRVKKGLDVQGPLGVGSVPDYGVAGQILVSGGDTAAPTWEDPSAGGIALNNVVEDTTPQLGGDLDAQSHNISTVNSITLDTTPTSVPATVGTMSWDEANETMQILLNGVTLQVGQEHIVRVKNNSNTTAIPDRTLVMFAGATGDTVKATPAITDDVSAYPSDYIIGITTEEIPADDFGFVTQFGFVNHVDTSDWTVGTLLYPDPATPGGFVTTKPAAPAWQTPIAAVTKQNASAGRIFVRAIPGIQLSAVETVEITSPENKELLVYNSTSGIWENKSLGDAGVITVSSGANDGTIQVAIDGSTSYEVSVQGLDSAAYTPSTDYATASHTHDDRYYTETEIDSALSAKAPINNATFTGTTTTANLVVDGDLTVNGTQNIIDTTNLSVTDSLIYLASDQYNTDVVDIGIYGAYGDSNPGHFHTGIVRDASDGVWKLVSGGDEPTANEVDFTGATYDTLKVGEIQIDGGSSESFLKSDGSSDASGGLAPTGAIMMWYTDTAPSGWLICNGQSTSGYSALAAVVGATVPNMQGVVPVGKNAGTFATLGATGGSENVTLDSTQVPSHSHAVSITTSSDSHTHTYSGNTGNISADHTHNYSGTTSSDSHSHSIPNVVYPGSGNIRVFESWSGGNTSRNHNTSADAHTHTFSGTTSGVSSNHYHGYSGTTSSYAHTHTVTGNTGNAGSTGSHSNLQPYVVINYIIKT
jgi:microcystin-dependent protein